MKIIILCFFSMLAINSYSQNPWQLVNEAEGLSKKAGERLTIPEKYDCYAINMKALVKQLKQASNTAFGAPNAKKAQLVLPFPGGRSEIFDFVESAAMSPGLAAKFPNIKSFKGQSTSNPHNHAWIDYSPEGFRAAINSTEGTIYIDPYFDQADEHYIVYNVKDHVVDTEAYGRTCGVQAYEENLYEDDHAQTKGQQQNQTKRAGLPVVKSVYRFALACTGTWGTQQGGTVDAVMAKMNTATNRLNSFFEPELAMKLELVDDNDRLIFFESNDPYEVTVTPDGGSNPGRQILGQNTGIINQRIGENAYDLGHVFTIRCTDGIGGVANLGSVCNATKGNGLSCVGRSNISNFMTSTTAHELGHQFTAGHTWNSCPGIQEQFSFDSNCEPGSGSTIMSYQGSCGSDNISGPAYSYYHVCSLDPIYRFKTNGGASFCGTRTPQENTVPDVWIEQEGGLYLPISTPFELTGYATDMDGDELLYSWEQTNNGFSAPLGSPLGNSATFRSNRPSTNPTRVFPKIGDVLAGRDNNEERLPTYSRDLNFAFTARDGNLDAGGVAWTEVGFKATDTAGPFRVTKPSQFTSTNVGGYIDVEWNVANTDNELVNCTHVDVYFSEDGGITFPHLIMVKTPNDGQERVRIPNVITSQGKVKVKGHGNIFFNINRNVIVVEEPLTAGFFMNASQYTFDFCLPNKAETTFTGSSFLGFEEAIDLEIVSGLPPEATFTFSQNPMPLDESSTLSLDFDEVLYSGTYDIVVRATAPGVDTVFQTISVDATGSYLGDLSLSLPADNTRGLSTIPDFEWNGSPNAISYTLQVATSPAFTEESILVDKNVQTDTAASILQNLENSTIYFWRIVTESTCAPDFYSKINTFSSNALSCKKYVADDLPLNIAQTGTPTIESVINVTDQGVISDLNVDLVKGNHNQVASLQAILRSPTGTEAILWQGECLNTSVFNAGFDSNSAFPNGCPNKNGNKIQALDDLAVFNGENLEGQWALSIFDSQAGNGGSLLDFELELCSTSALFSPYITNNEVLEVRVGSNNRISKPILLTEDDNNNQTELIYTIVESPEKGLLRLSGEVLEVGSRFSQATLDSGALEYKHEGNEEEEDTFLFIVEDGEGGWVEQTTFIIVMTNDGPSSIDNVEEAHVYFDIYPNPVSQLLNIQQLDQNNTDWQLELLSTSGQTIMRRNFRTALALDLSELNAGLYILNLSNQEKALSQKISVVR